MTVVENQLESKETELWIYRYIGGDGINGEDFARQIDEASKNSEQITLRINSIGGVVRDTFAILAAMERSTSHITAIVDGMACSGAALIAISADSLIMSDRSLLMFHRANMIGEPDLEMLAALDEALITVFKAKLNKTDEEAAEFFTDRDRWIGAKEALRLGFAHKIVETDSRADKVLNSAIEYVSLGKFDEAVNLYIETKLEFKMNEVLNMLSLPEATNEAEVVNAIKNLQSEITAKVAEVDALKAEAVTNAAEIKRLVDAVAVFELKEKEAMHTEIVNMVDDAIAKGKIKATAKDSFVKLAEIDLTSTREALNALPEKELLSKKIKNDENEVSKSFSDRLKEVQGIN